MKKLFFLLAILLIGCTKTDVFEGENQILIEPIAKCIDGFAGEYPCNDYDLLTHIPLEKFIGTKGNDCWGWVDPLTKKEYALMGTDAGITFIDITNPKNAVIIGGLKTRTDNSSWRDVKVHNSIAYIVSEADKHGMQLFNLLRLRSINNPPVEFTSDTDYTEFGSAHNIIINEESGFAYAVGAKNEDGSRNFNGGPHFIDLNIPFRPAAAGGFPDSSYSHDAQVVTYKGPDIDYLDKEILIGSNENEVVIVDVTDKENPKKISSITYSDIGYTHQGWFTEDFKYFLLGDELDEQRKGVNTRTIIFDFTDLDNPVFHFNYLGPTAAIDHNGYVKGNLFYQANYTAGVKIIDISNIENKDIKEVGFFDTHPENDNTFFNGAWNVYPYLPSGNIIISDINRGLFIIRKSNS